MHTYVEKEWNVIDVLHSVQMHTQLHRLLHGRQRQLKADDKLLR